MEAAVKAKNVYISYTGPRVVDGVSFIVPAGSITMIIGPNGSGKTTLLRAIAGLQSFEGDLEIFGKNVNEGMELLGYVPQRFNIDRSLPLKVKEFLTLSSPHCFTEKCEHTGLYEEVGIMPLLDKQVGELSGGQQQRILLARALLESPKLLLLDEPASGIDVEGQQSLHKILRRIVREKRTTVIMVSHEVELVNHLADHVLCLNRSLVCEGKPSQALTAKALRELFGEHTKIYRQNNG